MDAFHFLFSEVLIQDVHGDGDTQTGSSIGTADWPSSLSVVGSPKGYRFF